MQEIGALFTDLGITSPTMPSQENREFYSAYYKTENNDSPTKSRLSLISRLYNFISKQPSFNLVLDLGSGRQILEYEYAARLVKLKTPSKCHFFTVDIADMSTQQLLGDPNLCTHIQADGCELPFSDRKFKAIISNMALDFMGPEAINEVYRVLVSKGEAFFNFHHPSLIPPDLDHMITRIMKKMFYKKKAGSQIKESIKLEYQSLVHHKYLREHNILFESPDQIMETLSSHGFIVTHAGRVQDGHETWWEANVIKP